MITLKGVDPRMIANNLIAYEPTHPGEILKDEIQFRGISQRKLAGKMGISYSQFNEILNAKRALTTEIALLVEAALDIEAAPLLKMQTDYNIQASKSNVSFLKQLQEVRKVCAVL